MKQAIIIFIAILLAGAALLFAYEKIHTAQMKRESAIATWQLNSEEQISKIKTLTAEFPSDHVKQMLNSSEISAEFLLESAPEGADTSRLKDAIRASRSRRGVN